MVKLILHWFIYYNVLSIITMKKRARLSVQGLDENVVEAFRIHVIKRYGKLHTVFGLEIQKAMEAYLENNNEELEGRHDA